MAKQQSDGYQVKASGLDSMAKELDQCRADATAVAREFTAHAKTAEMGDAQAAWTSFQDALASKAADTHKLVAGLTQALTESASTYRNTESQNEATAKELFTGEAW